LKIKIYTIRVEQIENNSDPKKHTHLSQRSQLSFRRPLKNNDDDENHKKLRNVKCFCRFLRIFLTASSLTRPPYPLSISPVNHAGLLRAFPSSRDLLPGQSDPPPHPSLSSCPPAAAPPLDLSSTRGAGCRWATQWTSRSFALRRPDPPGSCWEKRREIVRATPVGAIARGRASSSPREWQRGLLGVCSPAGSCYTCFSKENQVHNLYACQNQVSCI
jgi:hypothetical protein